MISTPDYYKATNMAYITLQALNITTLPITITSAITRFPYLRIVPYSKFCKFHKINWGEFMSTNVSERGFIYREGKKAIIYYNDREKTEIVRFTLAHELGHYMLRHVDENSATDKEANCFARNFLCPIPITDHLRLNTVEECCNVFDISPVAAEVVLDKRKLDRLNASNNAYQNIIRLFEVESLTRESQLSRIPASFYRDFGEILYPDAPPPSFI